MTALVLRSKAHWGYSAAFLAHFAPGMVVRPRTLVRDDCLVDGRLDPSRYVPAARLGYHDYTFVREVRELRRPKDPAKG